jgi:hypothetical protein
VITSKLSKKRRGWVVFDWTGSPPQAARVQIWVFDTRREADAWITRKHKENPQCVVSAPAGGFRMNF